MLFTEYMYSRYKKKSYKSMKFQSVRRKIYNDGQIHLLLATGLNASFIMYLAISNRISKYSGLYKSQLIFLLPSLSQKKQVYNYRTDIGLSIIIVMMSLILLVFPSLIPPSYKVASEDPTMMSELEKQWKRERLGDIWCLHQEVKTFLAIPTDFTDISLTRIYHIDILLCKGD